MMCTIGISYNDQTLTNSSDPFGECIYKKNKRLS
jgi:hypothetical protein